MNVSHIQLEATRDAIVRKQNYKSVRREVDFTLNKSTAPIANKPTRTTGAADAWNSLLRVSQTAQIGVLQRTCLQAIFYRRFQHIQHVLQQRTTVPIKAYSDRIERRQQNETNRAVKQRSAREQKPLFEY